MNKLVVMLFPLFSVLASCDPVHPPFIRNDLHSEIELRIDYADGTSSRGALKPGGRLVFGPKGKDISRITVLSDRKLLYQLDSDAILALRRNGSEGQTWSIESDGIVPVRNR